MKSINCAVIQDLLPSYCDKVSSKETNLLVEEHLSECAKCREKFKILNKELNIETTNDQQEEIDFLKGYRKRKRISIIFAIITVLIIMNIIFILLGNVFPKYFTGKDYAITNIDDVNLEYMYWIDDYSNTLRFYLYSDKHKELGAYINNVWDPSTGKHGISIGLVGKRELRPLTERNMYESGYECSVVIKDYIDEVWIEDILGNKKQIWNRDTKVPSREEWARWYIDNYVPKEVKEKEHLDYHSILYSGFSTTGSWRHLYKINN